MMPVEPATRPVYTWPRISLCGPPELHSGGSSSSQPAQQADVSQSCSLGQQQRCVPGLQSGTTAAHRTDGISHAPPSKAWTHSQTGLVWLLLDTARPTVCGMPPPSPLMWASEVLRTGSRHGTAPMFRRFGWAALAQGHRCGGGPYNRETLLDTLNSRSNPHHRPFCPPKAR